MGGKSMILKCETEQDRKTLQLIFEGNGYVVCPEDLLLVITQTKLHPNFYPYLVSDYNSTKVGIQIPQQCFLLLEEIEGFLGQLEQIKDILEEIAFRVGTHYVEGYI